ncbi:hypothetical protein QBC44DRAFT_364144 [Cladorrhinum sp. PSN332]|nr:hypothetical protein QBC44DRAFT_364144 [Cladorrhinum sp. PSN332]
MGRIEGRKMDGYGFSTRIRMTGHDSAGQKDSLPTSTKTMESSKKTHIHSSPQNVEVDDIRGGQFLCSVQDVIQTSSTQSSAALFKNSRHKYKPLSVQGHPEFEETSYVFLSDPRKRFLLEGLKNDPRKENRKLSKIELSAVRAQLDLAITGKSSGHLHRHGPYAHQFSNNPEKFQDLVSVSPRLEFPILHPDNLTGKSIKT